MTVNVLQVTSCLVNFGSIFPYNLPPKFFHSQVFINFDTRVSELLPLPHFLKQTFAVDQDVQPRRQRARLL
jgi:hypothetical protein